MSTRGRWPAVVLVFGLAMLAPVPAAAAPRVLDAFEDAAAWTTIPASGVVMQLSTETGETGRALRVDFDFQKGGGYAVLQRKLDLDLPANYRFAVRVRGATGPQNFEFKLLDTSGENVWWKNRFGFVFPAEWQTVATKKRQIEFAWGPSGGGEMKHVAAIEFAITAGSGGKGTVWLDELTFEELPPPNAAPPPIVARASSGNAASAARAVDGDSTTAWRAGPAGRAPWIEFDLGIEREFGGLTIDWGPDARLADYDVRVALNDGAFRTVREVRGGRWERDWLYLPECEARRVRIEGVGRARRSTELREVTLQPLEFGSSMNKFYEAIAKASPRGLYPRGMRGEMQFWAVAGSGVASEEAFLSEDGAVDAGTGRFSVEPFVWMNGRLWTWADVKSEQTLEVEPWPVPSTAWHGAPVGLTVTAQPTDNGERAATWVAYRLSNRSRLPVAGTLYLAIRPFQVNPPSQFLNTPGGAVEIRSLELDPTGVRVDGGLEIHRPRGPAPSAFGAAPFDGGDVTRYLAIGTVPPESSASDSLAHASGALAYAFELAPNEEQTVEIVIKLQQSERFARPPARSKDSERLAQISLPPSAREVERSLVAQIGWIAVNRDGPRIQPGSRAYRRSWIRDGSLTSSALLRWGRHADVKDFLEWFAPFQYADGKVPCCVDWRGSDPVPEHDSHGQLIYLAAEYFRHTRDTSTVRRLWPNVAKAAGYLDTLRFQRLGPEWRTPDKREFYGILPPSISHEGYSAKPMHSYWDDFWALQGYEDAVFLARVLGHGADARRFDASRAAFRRDFAASIVATQAKHRIAYVPGCADLGDYDATSTTMALSPVQAADIAPPGAIETTFEGYWDFFRKRRDGLEKWEAFTPYEMRNIGAFVRLGWRDRAHELVDWFLKHRSPAGWAQWAEVVWNDPPGARFVGDIPHTWVGSDFVRSILDMLAYERERDDALVVGAGVSDAWVRESNGVSVRNLDTWYGPLNYHLRAEGPGIRLDLAAGTRVPRGGIVVAAPGVTRRWKATVNDRPAPISARGEVVVRRLPAIVRLTP